jgi:hypothetical protein
MQQVLEKFKVIERTLGSMKFAVVIIFLFMAMSIYGTFMESYHGTEYANRHVYKSWWFMGVQALMFLSITYATTLRLPPKKALYGFYTIHAGLLTLFIGSFVSYLVGVDGSLELVPGRPSNTIVIDEDVFKVKDLSSGKVKIMKLPYGAGINTINKRIDDIIINDFYPSASFQDKWVVGSPGDTSGSYLLYNENVSQKIQMSLASQSDYKSSLRMGPLSVHYMPEALGNCFQQQSLSGYLIWNIKTQECFSIESKNIKLDKTEKGAPAITYNFEGKDHFFFPDFSPLPVNKDFSKDSDSPLRIFSRKLFQDKPNLFIFGESIAFYKKRKNKWYGEKFKGEDIELPWMNFKIKKIDFKRGQYAVKEPIYIKPIQENSKIVEGNTKAVSVRISGQDFWVTNEKPLTLQRSSKKIRLSLEKKTLKLPYEISLDRFKMDKDPGTENPASYESYVKLLDGRTDTASSSHHVYMNNPLKYDGMTFYQASYFPFGESDFGSVFSVNFDPGRPLKYLGSLLLVLGSIWHYIIRRKSKRGFFQSLKTTVKEQ